MLSSNEKHDLFLRFPKIKLSYDHITHKKVHTFNYMIAMPSGIKAFAWFSIYKDKRVCYILEKQNIYIVNTIASSQLNYGIGTIFYGTILTETSFCIEEIYYYKGKGLQVKHGGIMDKLMLCKDIFTHDLGETNLPGFMHFGLPVIERKSTMTNVAYNISHIKYICENTVINSYILQETPTPPPPLPLPTPKTQQPQPQHRTPHPPHTRHQQQRGELDEVIFNVKPTIQNDIYTLHTFHNSKDDYYYGLAYIPTYTTSVMMNSIFRNIKENTNLDKLEESDSEEEFENDNMDKFVYLDRSYYMACVYNNKFKKWTPIKLAEKGARVISQREMEKNKH